mmetsp:Transcript_1087/g.1755  ORF Transcript_1087/g.1755 Transcript_1087/m.1755 type:complete len:247 (-) Transcript_1087:226-966(-)
MALRIDKSSAHVNNKLGGVLIWIILISQSRACKVSDSLICGTSVEESTVRQEYSFVEQCKHLRRRLVDGAHTCSILIGQVADRRHNLQSDSTIQSGGGLVQKYEVGKSDDFHGNGKTFQLPTRNSFVHGISNNAVFYVANPHHIQQELYALLSLIYGGSLLHTSPRRVTDGFFHSQGGNMDIILQHIRTVPIEERRTRTLVDENFTRPSTNMLPISDKVKKSTFSCSRGSHECTHVPRFQMKAYIL